MTPDEPRAPSHDERNAGMLSVIPDLPVHLWAATAGDRASDATPSTPDDAVLAALHHLQTANPATPTVTVTISHLLRRLDQAVTSDTAAALHTHLQHLQATVIHHRALVGDGVQHTTYTPISRIETSGHGPLDPTTTLRITLQHGPSPTLEPPTRTPLG